MSTVPHATALADFPALITALHGLDGVSSLSLSEPEDRFSNRQLAEAAVLVGLVPRPDGTRVVLTVRTRTLRKHAGQVSFPGGRVEAEDADAIAAAVRETGEEIGLVPAQIIPLGLLDPLVTVTGFRILPVVALIDPEYAARPDPTEVAEVFEVPLAFLLDPRNLAARVLVHAGLSREVLEYRYTPQRIWGATASILLSLRQRLERLR